MINREPLVSVICICYNHEQFVYDALSSVINQTYKHVELIVVDDCSLDNSVAVIQNFVVLNSSVIFISLPKNMGNCKAFNTALELAKGEFIIDLAADDILLPERVHQGVALFNEVAEVGVVFSDAEWINVDGEHLYFHSQRFPHHTIPEGDVYAELIKRFFICSPSMMYRRSVLDALGGYDESLAYEDFDFWIRSSRICKYAYKPEVLVKKRVVPNSLSHRQRKQTGPQAYSTFAVCEKIMHLNRSQHEQRALSGRILYELKHALRLSDFKLAYKYVMLYFQNRSLRY